MTTGGNDASLSIGRGAWVRFAMDASERWLAMRGEPPSEMSRFGLYLRELRYRSGNDLSDLAHRLQVPYEQLAMLEQGLLKPSEFPSGTWVRLMQMLEGRERAPAPADARPTARTTAATETADVSDDDDTDGPGTRPAVPAATPVPRAPGQPVGAARIKVVGVGGGGSNAVARMYRQRMPGVEYVAVNTDAQHLLHIDVPDKLRLGERLTRGLGVGGDPELGHEAAEESREELYDLLAGVDMVFITCGMGGGTGTGAAPLIAEIAHSLGALTIATVTKPFSFEGYRRIYQAEQGIIKLRPQVDTLIMIPNDRLVAIADPGMTAENAFRIADDVLRQGVQAIAELVTVPGEINLDFADVRTVMMGSGPAWMAIGHARGENRASEAAKAAMASPLIDVPIEGATRVLLNITGGSDLTLQEVQESADFISKMVDPEAHIIFGMVTDPKMEDEVRITVIATGLPQGVGEAEQSLEQLVEDSLAETAPRPTTEEPPEPSVELPGFLKSYWLRLRGDKDR